MIKQLQIERGISVFDKQTEEFVKRVPIHLSLEQLKVICPPYDDDPLMYDVYKITKELAEKINELDKEISLDTNSFIYELDCIQVK